jgi:hypothetical protein
MKRLATAMLVASVALGVAPGSARQVKRLVAASVKIHSLTSVQDSALPNLAAQNADVLYQIPTACTTDTACVYGTLTSSQTVVLYGDSHIRMWMPALLPNLAKDRVVLVGQDGCTALAMSGACGTARADSLSVIAALHPSLTILADYTSAATVSGAQWKAGLESLLEQIGGKIVVIGDITQLNLSPQQCLSVDPSSVQKCAVSSPNLGHPGNEAAEVAATRALNVPYINPQNWLCTKKCSPVIGPFLAYWDKVHISIQYAAYLSKVMGVALKGALAGLS